MKKKLALKHEVEANNDNEITKLSSLQAADIIKNLMPTLGKQTSMESVNQLFFELKKKYIESILESELTDHLGYNKNEDSLGDNYLKWL